MLILLGQLLKKQETVIERKLTFYLKKHLTVGAVISNFKYFKTAASICSTCESSC